MMGSDITAANTTMPPHAPSHRKKPPTHRVPFTAVLWETLCSIFKAAFSVTLVYFILRNYVFSSIYSENVDRRLFCLVAIFICHTVMYVGVNSVSLALQYYRVLGPRMQIQRRKMFPDSALVWRALKDALKDQLISTVVLYTILPTIFAFGAFETNPDSLPSYTTVFVHTMLNQIWLDTSFYFVHKALHLPAFYAPIHKKHHEFSSSVGFAAEYAHWIEQMVSNVIPTFALCILARYHIVELISWLTYRLFETYEAHSGLTVFFNSNGFHDFHHSSNQGNYGIAPFWDYIHSTIDPQWAEHHVVGRHRVTAED